MARYLLFSFVLLIVEVILIGMVSPELANLSAALKAEFRDLLSFRYWRFFLEVTIGVIAIIIMHALFAVLLDISEKGFKRIFKVQMSWYFLTFVVSSLWLSLILMLASQLYPYLPFSFSSLTETLLVFPIAVVCLVLLFAGLIIERRKAIILPIITGLAFVTYGFTYSLMSNKKEHTPELQRPPDIILVGVDSLRADHLNPVNTPFLATETLNATKLMPAYTPVARTFGAWVSILTGKYPTETGARFNLTDLSKVTFKGSLQESLKNLGYRTIFAQDERRFNNIGKKTGFDVEIGPPATAAEFILTSATQIPVVALFSKLPLLRDLFPYSYGNRSAWATYEPSEFTTLVKKSLETVPLNQPVFLAVHHTLPHHPFKLRRVVLSPEDPINGIIDSSYMYKAMIFEADLQVKNLMEILKRQGRLDNALVIYLSDHGESFFDEPTFPKKAIENVEGFKRSVGHGTSILDSAQFRVVIAAKNYGRFACNRNPKTKDVYSLIDIAPYINECVFGTQSIEGEKNIFMETSLNQFVMKKDRIDELATITKGAGFYRVNEAGNIIFKPEALKQSLSSKERAIANRNEMLISYPDMSDELLYVDLVKNTWWPASVVEDRDTIQSLFNQLCDHFKADTRSGVFDHCRNKDAFYNGIYKKWE